MGLLPKKNKDPADLQSRRAILWMHPESLIRFMTSKRWVINEGHLPDDTKFHHVFYDANKMIWGLVVISKDFKPLKIGEPMPELPPVSFRFYNPDKDGVVE